MSLIGLILLSPLLPIIALFIKLDSRGPVFYAAKRVGKDMKFFSMYKFRTMLIDSVKIDQSVCPQYDPRVTSAGRILRRTKLNELPQLLNILKGDMSFVGPRPEAPDLMELYPEDAKKIFTVMPGLVGPAVISSLKDNISGRNEEEMYPKGVDPNQYYIEHILPEKIKIDLYYLSRQTVGSYFRIILAALKETILGAVTSRKSDRSRSQAYQTNLIIADVALSQLSFAFAYWAYIRLADGYPSVRVFFSGLVLVIVARPVIHYLLGAYNFIIELITPHDVHRIVPAVGLGSLFLLAVSAVFRDAPYPPLLATLDFFALSLALVAVRWLMMARFRRQDDAVEAVVPLRVVIFGANRKGLTALKTLIGSKSGPYDVVGFIDDVDENYGKKISGFKVLGNRHHIKALSVLYNVQELIIVPGGDSKGQIDEIVALCAQAGIRPRLFSLDNEEKTRRRISYPLRSIHIADLLPQLNVRMDETDLRNLLPEKTVMMVGSGGELGSALCRYIFHCGCRKLVIADRYESYLNKSLAKLMHDIQGSRIVPAILDSQDIDALNALFVLHRPQIVIHAGMMKYISPNKPNYEEVARSNYVRTFNLAKTAARHGCGYFLMISSIKAAYGGNFVSDSLRIAEISLSRFFNQTSTRLIVTRTGNIIENKGGIVSWLNDQILERRLLRLPADSAKAFLLSKTAAARSILQALVIGSRISPGGLLLTSEPGISVGFHEIAEKIANYYGLKLGVDIPLSSTELIDAFITDAPETESRERLEEDGRGSGSQVSVTDLEGDRTSLMLEDLISSDSRHLSDQDWRRRTEEIISQYGHEMFGQSKESRSN